MRNLHIDTVDALPRSVVAIGTDYPPDTLLATHSHRRAQFLYGATGLMEVGTDDGAWVVPPLSGVWIPAGRPHRVRMLGVRTCSVYIEPEDAARAARQCEVLHVAPLLRQLLLEAVDVPADYDTEGRDGLVMRLLLQELARAPALPLHAPLPRMPGLAALCARFLRAPDIRATPAHWAQQLHTSPRSFTRLFRRETGLSFGAWRRQACLMAALSRLAAGASVTTVALELGYESPGAFSTMFRRQLGRAPSTFLAASRSPAELPDADRSREREER